MEETLRFPLHKPNNEIIHISSDELDAMLLKEANEHGFETYREYLLVKNKPSDTIYYIDFKYNDTE